MNFKDTQNEYRFRVKYGMTISNMSFLRKQESDLRKILYMFFIILFCSEIYCGNGKDTFDFVKINQGAKQVSLGGAYTPIANDAMAIFYNNAGLAFLNKKNITISYIKWVEDIAKYTFAYSWPLKENKISLGLGLDYLSPGEIDFRDVNGNKIASNFGNMVINFSPAYKMNDDLSLGLGVKLLYQTIGNDSGNGLALDTGVLYKRDKLNFGLSLQNLGPKFKLGSSESSLPLQLRLGAGFLTKVILASAQIDYFLNEKALIFGAGFEYNIDVISLRAGYRTDSGATFGLGFSSFKEAEESYLRLDYSLTSHKFYNLLHQVSISYQF